MLTLGIDSFCYGSLCRRGGKRKALGEFFVNTKQTHSQTLLPMVQSLLDTVGTPAMKWMFWRSPTDLVPLRGYVSAWLA